MPVDEEGNRADVVCGGEATVSRMNLGRLFEFYISSACVKVHRQICEMAGIKYGESNSVFIQELVDANPALVERIKNHVLGYYGIVNPTMCGWFSSGEVVFDAEYAAHLLHRGVPVYLPHNGQKEYRTIVREIEASIYKPIRKPVTYIGNSGKQRTTKENVRIGPLYFLLLEKIGDDWAAVDSPKMQTTGVPAGNLSKQDKYGGPARKKPTRVIGESEGRNISSYTGGRTYAELMDRNNNPIAQTRIVDAILTAEHPTNIECVVDRDEVGIGGSKSLQMVNHLLEVAGSRLIFADYQPPWNTDDVPSTIDY